MRPSQACDAFGGALRPSQAIAEMRRTLGADNSASDPFRFVWEHTFGAKRMRHLRATLSPARLCELEHKPGGLYRAAWCDLTPSERAAVKVRLAGEGAPGVVPRSSREWNRN